MHIYECNDVSFFSILASSIIAGLSVNIFIALSCSFSYLIKEPLTNVATATYPKWLCAPCAKSRRGLLDQGRGSPENKALLKFLEKSHPEKIRHCIRCCRVKPKDEAIDIVGVQTVDMATAARSNEIATYKRTTEFSSGLKSFVDLLQPNKKEFIAHRVYKRGDTEAEALELWKTAMRQRGLDPENEANFSVRLPVMDMPRARAFMQRSTSKAVCAPDQSITDSDGMKDALNSLTAPADFGVALHTQFRDMGGDQFKPGAFIGDVTAVPKSTDADNIEIHDPTGSGRLLQKAPPISAPLEDVQTEGAKAQKTAKQPGVQRSRWT